MSSAPVQLPHFALGIARVRAFPETPNRRFGVMEHWCARAPSSMSTAPLAQSRRKTRYLGRQRALVGEVSRLAQEKVSRRRLCGFRLLVHDRLGNLGKG